MNNYLFVDLVGTELVDINGGNLAKAVTEQALGVAGAISSGIGGFVAGNTLAGSVFFPVVSVPVGVVTGISGGAAGYVGGKSLGGKVYDIVTDIF